MGNSSSSKEAEEKARKQELGLLSELEYERLQRFFKESLGGVEEKPQKGKKTFTGRSSTKKCFENETVSVSQLVHKLDLEGTLGGETSLRFVSTLFNAETDSTLSFSEFKQGFEMFTKGTKSEFRFLVFKLGKAITFPIAFRLFYAIDTSQENSSLTLAEDKSIDHIVKGLKDFVTLRGGQVRGKDVVLSEISFDLFNLWCEHQFPSLLHGFKEWLTSKILNVESRKENESICPKINSVLDESILKEEMIYALSRSKQCLRNEWQSLFSSSVQGLSFELLAKSLIGYEGPTMIVIKDTCGNVFGAFTTTTWKEDTRFYGDSNSTLFAIWPRFLALPARVSSAEDAQHFQYLNVKSRTKEHGIGFGGRDGALRLWLDSNFEACVARSIDYTYEKGALRVKTGKSTEDDFEINKEEFSVYRLEAWGFGGKSALDAQKQKQKETAELIQGRRQVDKKQFANSAFDREFLLGKTFQAQKNAQDR